MDTFALVKYPDTAVEVVHGALAQPYVLSTVTYPGNEAVDAPIAPTEIAPPVDLAI